ncbi:MAG: hypothetical protein AAFR75_07765 [Pseudomonadota bacterium]
MTHNIRRLRTVLAAGLALVCGAFQAHASLHPDTAVSGIDAQSIVAEAAEQSPVLVAQWNQKKVRGIVKEYTGSTGSGSKGKKKDCKTITHTNPKVQKKLRQICKYQQ